MKKIALIILIAVITFSFSTPEITWVAIGDSITYLNDHQNETGNRVAKGYMSRVVEKIPEITYINQGHNGWTSGGIADKIESLGLVKADLYTVFLGTNDWWQGRQIGTLTDYSNNNGNTTVFGSFRIIIEKLRTLNPAAKIILITPMQRADFVYINDMKNNAWGSYKEKNNQKLADFAEAVKAIGNYEKFPVIDLYHEKRLAIKNLVNFKRLKDPKTGLYKNYTYPNYIGMSFNPDTDEYPYPTEAIHMTYDGLHPSDQGYELIADKLIEIIRTSQLLK
jgi:lysophospholipase L1-like esterase